MKVGLGTVISSDDESMEIKISETTTAKLAIEKDYRVSIVWGDALQMSSLDIESFVTPKAEAATEEVAPVEEVPVEAV